MDQYDKGKIKEVQEVPVFTLGDKDIHMQVNGGSKIRNLIGYALKKFKEPDTKQICWSGAGKAITKTVSCAEILKCQIKGLHQITKIMYKRIEEFQEPKLEGLDRLKVNRDIPTISILLSKVPLDMAEPGYQAPGDFDDVWKEQVQNDTKHVDKVNSNKRSHVVMAEGDKSDISGSHYAKSYKKHKKSKRNTGKSYGNCIDTKPDQSNTKSGMSKMNQNR